MFWVFALLAIGGAAGVVTLRNAFFGVVALVAHLVALASLFLLLNAEFLAAAQGGVSAGGVRVLYVFVAAYIGGGDEPMITQEVGVARAGPIFAIVLFVELAIA